MAPEIIEINSYTNKSDLWSVGMIIYEMLHSYTPYDDAINPMDLLRKIKKRNIVYDISDNNAIDLLKKLLVIDHEKRLDWDSFFNHTWIVGNTIEHTEDDDDSIELFDASILNNVVIIDDYYKNESQSKSSPMNIPIIKTSSSSFNNYKPSSLPVPTTITKNIVEFMTSSVGGIVRGTFNYLSQ
jgi:serine/threonine protein kinase